MSKEWRKGPWSLEDVGFEDGQYITVFDSAGWRICNVEAPATPETAALISAAPDLAEALADVLRTWEAKSGFGTVVEMERALAGARAALAKARGEQ